MKKSLGSRARQKVVKLSTKSRMSKRKMNKSDFTTLKSFALWKTLKREVEKTNYRLGENNCKPPIWQKTCI